MKHTLYLLASDTSRSGTEVFAFATEARRDDHLLAILRHNGSDPELLEVVDTSPPTARHAAIQFAWDYYTENCTDGLDTYCLEDVELDLPPEEAGATLTAAPCRYTLAATIMAGLHACPASLVHLAPGETKVKAYARIALDYADALLAHK